MSGQEDKKTTDKKTKRQKDKKTKREKDKKTKREKDKKTKRQKDKKTKRQIPKGELNFATSGQFRTLAMFFIKNIFAQLKTTLTLKTRQIISRLKSKGSFGGWPILQSLSWYILNLIFKVYVRKGSENNQGQTPKEGLKFFK